MKPKFWALHFTLVCVSITIFLHHTFYCKYLPQGSKFSHIFPVGMLYGVSIFWKIWQLSIYHRLCLFSLCHVWKRGYHNCIICSQISCGIYMNIILSCKRFYIKSFKSCDFNYLFLQDSVISLTLYHPWVC